MNIGYACLTLGVSNTNFKTCTLKNASVERLMEIIDFNLDSLDKLIDYNIENDIKLFRISSDIIPFASSPVNRIEWWRVFSEKFKNLGKKIASSHMRVSMHPGQYTVLNSLTEDVVKRAVDDLIYHNRFLDSLNTDGKNKIILHIGGVYGDKKSAVERFKNNYKKLPDDIKSRLVIENDDKSYSISEVLEIGRALNIPVVYDNLHNEVLPSDPSKSDLYWIDRARNTWKTEDGTQKIHYSQQNQEKRRGSHSETIDLKLFKKFFEALEYDLDIMLEVKDKNLSAIKVINYLKDNKIKNLELEWSRYKYNILEHSPSIYNRIRNLLKDKSSYPILEFYRLIDQALGEEIIIKNGINAAEHVWGYFKDISSEKEKEKFFSYLNSYEKGSFSVKAIKGLLQKMAVKYDEEYLLSSYYFHF